MGKRGSRVGRIEKKKKEIRACVCVCGKTTITYKAKAYWVKVVVGRKKEMIDAPSCWSNNRTTASECVTRGEEEGEKERKNNKSTWGHK